MKPKVLVGHPLSSEVRSRFSERFDEAESLSEAEAALGFVSTSWDLDQATMLRAVATVSAGYDNYDVDDLTRRGIALMNCPEALTETTADLAFALILATARRVVELALLVKEGGWTAGITEERFGVDVWGKTLGVVGFGRIGQAVGRRGALGFGMNVLYASRSAKAPGHDAERCELDELLRRSDFVCLTVPLSPETTRMIGKRELSLMRTSAILVNVARGAVVDEGALITALERGQIRGAGLDVYEREPLPADSPLIRMENVVTLPHVGSATTQTRDAMAMASVENLIRFFEGKPQNVVNQEVLKR